VTGKADALEKERDFHRLLEAADRGRSAARTGGTEWFLTSTRLLNEIASVLGLELRPVAGLGATDLE
jgi:hypothetical protein